MAGEYYRWLARDVQPEQPAAPDPEQQRQARKKRITWAVVIGLIAAVLVGDLIYDLLHRGRSAPDLYIAYVGRQAMPAGAEEAIEAVFEGLCRDVSGNGRVEVEFSVYVVPANDPTEEILTGQHVALSQGASMALLGDLDGAVSTIFLLEDPEWFQEEYRLLTRIDGTLPEDTPDSRVPVSIPWSDCPELQEALPGLGLHLARRGFWNGEESDAITNALELWQRILPPQPAEAGQ